jgi:hypothetical protein
MERASHHLRVAVSISAKSFYRSVYPVRRVEGFFNAISMVDIDINVKHSLMKHIKFEGRDLRCLLNLVFFKELKNREHTIIYVAESAGFTFLCVVQSTCPVDDNVRRSVVQTNSTTCCTNEDSNLIDCGKMNGNKSSS